MPCRRDTLLLNDLELQPLWLLWLYIALGVAATGTRLATLHFSVEAIACVGGGFLVALGAEKLVTRRIRAAAIRALPHAG